MPDSYDPVNDELGLVGLLSLDQLNEKIRNVLNTTMNFTDVSARVEHKNVIEWAKSGKKDEDTIIDTRACNDSFDF